ncbi:MAG: hypothetical protein RLZZ156_714 [Deinococcota bacterium]|jgi:hypothetical protein
MPNAVYDIVCDALSRIVSHRAAENIVSDALRGAKLSPLDVRPEQMQSLLKSEVFRRLQQIIPVAQAKGEIRQILTALETQFTAARAFSPEVEEGWLALRDEFRKIDNQTSNRAQRLGKSIAQLPDSTDPVRVLNDLWAELDLLQLELSPSSIAPVLESRYQGDLLLESGEFASLNFELDHFDSIVPDPVGVSLGRPGAVVTPRPDAVVTTSSDLVVAPRSDAVVAPRLDSLDSPRMHQDVHLTIVDEPTPNKQTVTSIQSGFQLENIAPLELDLAGLVAAPVVAADLVVAPVITSKDFTDAVALQNNLLESAESQEALLTRFALEEGVTGVLLSKRNGDVIAARLSIGSANHLAGVVAATTMLLAKRRHFRVFYTHLESVSAFIAPLGDQLLTVLADASVNVGRVFTELESLKETA